MAPKKPNGGQKNHSTNPANMLITRICKMLIFVDLQLEEFFSSHEECKHLSGI